jgi:hypothetical protein
MSPLPTGCRVALLACADHLVSATDRESAGQHEANHCETRAERIRSSWHRTPGKTCINPTLEDLSEDPIVKVRTNGSTGIC